MELLLLFILGKNQYAFEDLTYTLVSIYFHVFLDDVDHILLEQACLTERERQKLQVWSRIMPHRESFAWAILPLFDNNIGAASGGSASPSSPLPRSVSGSSSHDGGFEPVSKITLHGKLGYTSGSSVVVEISSLNKVKESYTEDSLQVEHDNFVN